MLERDPKNPILIARTDLSWCNKKVYNCAVICDGDEYKMLFRAIGDNWISRLGLASSHDGVNFTIQDEPVFAPTKYWENHGCEDPRLIKIDNTFFLTYTAFDGTTARAAIAYSKDLLNWPERKLLFPHISHDQRENLPSDWSKSAGIFPEKVGENHFLLFGDNHIWGAVYQDLVGWQALPEPILSRRDGYFDSAYVEMGPPPILTDHGWLVLYHGIDRTDNQRTYALGAALFEANNPLKLIWRSTRPILKPEESYEILGFVDVVDGGFETLKTLSQTDLDALAKQQQLPKAIFCCGAILEDDCLRIYYSGGDTVICTATIELSSIFEF